MSTASLAARAHRHRRVRKKVSGTANRPRLAVYRSNRYIYAQLVDDLSGHTLVSASSQERELRKERLTVETATKVGELLGTRATQADIKTAVFDRGGRQYHGRVQALADAARKAGLEF